MTFYVNEQNDHWSSIDIGWAGRSDNSCRPTTVEAITLNDIFDRFGTPLFVKIDVEGMEKVVLNPTGHPDDQAALCQRRGFQSGIDFIETLAHCGYDGFKLLDQSTVPSLRDSLLGRVFTKSSSGPFGKDVPGHWLDKHEVLKLYAETVSDRASRHPPRARNGGTFTRPSCECRTPQVISTGITSAVPSGPCGVPHH